MLIRNEFAIEFNMPQGAAMIGLLRLHPSLDARVRFPEMLKVEHLDAAAGTAAEVKVDEYVDVYGNRCSRFWRRQDTSGSAERDWSNAMRCWTRSPPRRGSIP